MHHFVVMTRNSLVGCRFGDLYMFYHTSFSKVYFKSSIAKPLIFTHLTFAHYF
jgi:hypothetical protein